MPRSVFKSLTKIFVFWKSPSDGFTKKKNDFMLSFAVVPRAARHSCVSAPTISRLMQFSMMARNQARDDFDCILMRLAFWQICVKTPLFTTYKTRRHILIKYQLIIHYTIHFAMDFWIYLIVISIFYAFYTNEQIELRIRVWICAQIWTTWYSKRHSDTTTTVQWLFNDHIWV